MSIKALNWVWQQPIKGNSKLVLLALADCANDDGGCWPGIKTIAKKCGISHVSVIKNLNKLSKFNLINSQRRYNEDGRRTSNYYTLNLNKDCLCKESLHKEDLRKENEGLSKEGLPESLDNRKSINVKKINKRKVTIPKNFCLSDSMIEYAKKNGVTKQRTLEIFTDNFILQNKAKGYKYVDHESAWKSWLRKAIDDGSIQKDPVRSEGDY